MLVQIHVFGPITIVKTRLLRLSLFWHFLDIVWIGIFSIVYLPGFEESRKKTRTIRISTHGEHFLKVAYLKKQKCETQSQRD
jgi:hypothetical protein